MIHPSQLLRYTEEREEFSAPADEIRNYRFDVGIKYFPWLTKCIDLERYARPGIFLTVLAFVGFLQGAVQVYFRGTAQIWSKHYKIDQDTVDWLIYINDVLIALFALIIGYLGYRTHRVVWIAGLSMYLGISVIMLAFPEITVPMKKEEIDIGTFTGSALCNSLRSNETHPPYEKEKVSSTVIIAMFIVYQLMNAMFKISYITHGITYIDDNMSKNHSPAYIGVALAAPELGKQLGLYLSWTPYIIGLRGVFISPIWWILAVLIFICSFLLSLFPRELPNKIIKQLSAAILDFATHTPPRPSSPEPTIGFFHALKNIVTNPILVLNIAASLSIQSALINFAIYEKEYNQVKYFIPKMDASGFSDPKIIQVTTTLFENPVIALMMLATGILITKFRPSAKVLSGMNVAIMIFIVSLFASVNFLNCNKQIENDGGSQLSFEYCHSKCNCPVYDSFQPVCLEGKTYFSPCYAGCREMAYNNDYKVFRNCSCADNEYAEAMEGSCNSVGCKVLLSISQINGVTIAALLAFTIVSNMIINMRCVYEREKVMALATELTLLGFVPHIPIRGIYHSYLYRFCKYLAEDDTCRLSSDNYAYFDTMTTVILLVIAVGFQIIVYLMIEYIQVYERPPRPRISYPIPVNVWESYTLQELRRREQEMQAFENDRLLGDENPQGTAAEGNATQENAPEENAREGNSTEIKDTQLNLAQAGPSHINLRNKRKPVQSLRSSDCSSSSGYPETEIIYENPLIHNHSESMTVNLSASLEEFSSSFINESANSNESLEGSAKDLTQQIAARAKYLIQEEMKSMEAKGGVKKLIKNWEKIRKLNASSPATATNGMESKKESAKLENGENEAKSVYGEEEHIYEPVCFGNNYKDYSPQDKAAALQLNDGKSSSLESVVNKPKKKAYPNWRNTSICSSDDLELTASVDDFQNLKKYQLETNL